MNFTIFNREPRKGTSVEISFFGEMHLKFFNQSLLISYNFDLNNMKNKLKTEKYYKNRPIEHPKIWKNAAYSLQRLS